MESGKIKDEQITASSTYASSRLGARFGRLNKNLGRNGGSWAAKTRDTHQWLQINLGGQLRVTATTTQGRAPYNQWVKTYKLKFSNDGKNFQTYKEDGKDKVKLTGNVVKL